MRVIVVGAGLIGVASAYALQRAGFDVTMIERRSGPALETSYANGTLITPSMSDPWNSPGCWRMLLSSLVRSDTPLKLRISALPSLSSWGVTFLLNSAGSRFGRNTLNNLALALYAQEALAQLRADTGIQFDQVQRGTLRIFRDRRALDAAAGVTAELARFGVASERLTRFQTVEREPALAPIGEALAGALLYPGDESGDARLFCVELARIAAKAGVKLRYDCAITRLERNGARISAIWCGEERLTADQVVIAAGSYTTALLQRIGVNVPVRPAKGYSITFERDSEAEGLRTPVVDDALHAVVAPLPGMIRAAGTAEFAGFDLTMRPERMANLISLLKSVLPNEDFDPALAQPWCGLRPMSADGVPIIGATPVSNLWLNTGHGHLGWTMAAGSGALLAQIMSRAEPAIDPTPYSLKRFAGW